MQYPKYLELFSRNIADYFKDSEIDLVISPAVGGIVLGTEIGRVLQKRTVFAERVDGKMEMRRGFEIKLNEKVLIVEDVITTGGSVKEVMNLVEKFGGNIVGVGVIVDRSLTPVFIHDNYFSITTQKAKIFNNTSDAISDFDIVISLSARKRDINKKHISINQFLKMMKLLLMEALNLSSSCFVWQVNGN